MGVDPGRPQCVIEIAQRHMGQVEAQQIDALGGEAAENRRP